MYQSDLPPKAKNLPVHPVWRGIGCLIIVFIPLIMYLVASLLIENRSNLPWLIIPQDLVIPTFKDQFLLVKILFSALGSLVIAALIAFVTFLLNRILGPSKYGPVDIPLDQIDKQ
jgi:hypothetical protein